MSCPRIELHHTFNYHCVIYYTSVVRASSRQPVMPPCKPRCLASIPIVRACVLVPARLIWLLPLRCFVCLLRLVFFLNIDIGPTLILSLVVNLVVNPTGLI